MLSDKDDNLCMKEPLIVPIINCSDMSDIASSKLSIGAVGGNGCHEIFLMRFTTYESASVTSARSTRGSSHCRSAPVPCVRTRRAGSASSRRIAQFSKREAKGNYFQFSGVVQKLRLIQNSFSRILLFFSTPVSDDVISDRPSTTFSQHKRRIITRTSM